MLVMDISNATMRCIAIAPYRAQTELTSGSLATRRQPAGISNIEVLIN